MNATDRILVEKMVKHIDEITSFVSDLDYDRFVSDIKTMYACAFAMAQIYELAFGTAHKPPSKKLSEEALSKLGAVPWKGISKTRAVVVHHYDTLNPVILWDTLTDDLPWIRQILITCIEENFN
jgi:uncharacterized protein with HEPN domain